jgi:outer membrane receptor protein involved in Fe transport
MKRFLSIAATVLIAMLVLVWSVQAQTETGTITGTITDPTGAVVPDAKVTARNVATNAVRVVTTNTAGTYIVSNLIPADYLVIVEAGGFTTQQRAVNVTVGARVGQDIQLTVGQSTTTVEVTEVATAVNTETQTLATTVNETQLRELPTLTRDPYSLISTSANVSDAGAGGRGVGFSINGQRESGTNVLLDGSANNNEFTAGVGQRVPLDSIQEFSVLTGNFTAEYGRASGGIVNVVTKSGTNDFHGTAYEFNRVSQLASNGFNNNAYEIPKPVFTRNQFGYSLGGPVKKDKLFFFSSTEWIRIRSMAVSEVYLPDTDLLAASAPNTQQFFQTYGKLASGASILDRYSINQLSALGTNLCGTNATCKALDPNMPVYDLVAYNAPGDAGGGNPENEYQTIGRVDYNMSDKTQMYGRYALQSIGFFPGYVSSSPYQGYNTTETDFNNNVLFSVVHAFTPQLISQSKVVFNRLNQSQPFGGYGPVPTLYTGATGTNAILGNSVIYPGYSPFTPGNGIPFGGPQNFVQVYEDLSRIVGKHSLRFGGSFEYLRDNRTFGAYETSGNYLGTGSLGSGVAGLVTGNMHQFQVAIDPQGKFPGDTVTLPLGQPNFSRSNRYKESALYFQDSWKITSRLTVNLGLRWEYYGIQHNKDPKLDANFYFPSGQIGTPQGVQGGTVQLAPQSPVGGLWAPDYKDFAPRVGFAWDVFGDGKTSLRGGYGIGYERNFGNVTFNAIQNPPNYETVSVVGTAAKPIPISVDNLGPFSGSSGTLKLPAATLRVPIQNIVTAYAHMWSASLEHQFTRNLLVAADYSGSKGVNLYDISVDNRYGYGNVFLGLPCSYDAGDCTAKLNNQYSGINVRGNNGFSNYNALTVRTRLDNLGNSGLHLNFNYTWSHAIDNLSTTFSDADALSNNWGQFVTGMLDPFAPNLNKGNADYDARHRLVVSAVWDVPGPKTGKGLATQVLGGWSVAPIFTARTGSPYTIFDCTNAYNFCPMAAFTAPVSTAANGSPTPVGAPNTFNYLTIPSSVYNYTNPTYFYSDLPPFPNSMTSRNAFRAPGVWNLDMGLYKSFKLSERFKLQFRAEAYNIFNHANLYVVANNADVSSTSYIPAERLGRRNVQLAAKLIF